MDKLKEKPKLSTSAEENGTNSSSSSSSSSSSNLNNNNSAVKPKEKRRSNEKRKEKSRDAARCRRSRETEIFTELSEVLPVRREDVEQLDKASIMRVSIAFLKVREMLKLFPKVNDDLPVEKKTEKCEKDEEKPFDIWNSSTNIKILSEALDGFLMFISGDGDVTYVSDNISDFLGIPQIDIVGQQIWEYSHQCDHEELKEALNMRKIKTKQDDKDDTKKDSFITAHRDFFIRFKCTLTSRGRSVNIKSASYKVIHVTGHMVMNSEGDRILIAVGRPLPHPSNIEIPLGSTTFLTKHSLDMKFTYVDDKMQSLLGYEPEDLLGKSLYDCHHGGDSESLMTTFKSVLSKGQGETCRFRFLGKRGGYCWIVTQATIVYDKQKPQSVVCVNYAISDLENNNEIYSCAQLEAYRKENEIIQKTKEDQQEQQEQQKQQELKEDQQQNLQEQKQQKSDIIEEKQQQKSILQPILQPKSNNNSKSKSTDIPVILQREINNKNNNNNNNNNNNSNNITKVRYRESSLSPIRRTFNNCTISTPPRLPEKSPKSVTASVFSKVRVPDRNILLNSIFNNTPISNPPSSLSSSNLQSIDDKNINHNSVSGGSRAQSVTASVFTPISALPNFNAPNRISLFGCNNNNTNNINKISNNSFVVGDNKKLNNINNITNKIFTQQQNRSEDMNKGFLSFTGDNTDITMLKEEPDDLTHLAPTAGDACIPLDESTPLFGEMLEGLILPDSYGTLLHDDINSLDSQQSNCNNSKSQIDPFINYREESSDTNSSPHLLSPGGASKSPEVSSIPSLCSPHSLSQEDEFAFMTMNVEDDIDLTMRAPYIPMNEQEDLPLLTDDLMWSTFSEELKEIKEALQMEAIKNANNINSGGLNVIINGTTSMSNSNDGDNESTSLASILCGNASIQQQQHQQQHHVQTITDEIENNKKRKFDQPDTGGDGGGGTNIIVESIGHYGQNFSKNSTNDSWTMNDLLQINSTQNSTSINHQENNIRPEKQTIIVNRAIPTTIHVPYITTSGGIHNNANNKLTNISSMLFRSNSTANTVGISNNVSNKCNNSSSNNNNNNNNNNNDELAIRKFATKILSTTSPPNNTCLKVINNLNSCVTGGGGGGSSGNSSNSGTSCGDHNNNPMICNNKRHLNIAATLDSKRVKNSSSIEIQTSPQLLQQLMAPTPQKFKLKSQFDKAQSKRWGPDGEQISGNTGSTSSMAVPPSSSNSVLKNLLVSGCDDPLMSRSPLPDIVMNDDNSRDSIRDLQISPEPYYSRPLYCKTSADQLIRNFTTGSNPMIGGTGILPSPPIAMPATDDNLPPGLVSINDSDSASDSGIECNIQNHFSSNTISKSSSGISNLSILSDPGGQMDITQAEEELKYLIDGTSIGNGTEDPPPLERDKTSYPFLDTNNPLCSPFLFELCDDDYRGGINDASMENDFLQDNEITEVLNEWTTEMT